MCTFSFDTPPVKTGAAEILKGFYFEGHGVFVLCSHSECIDWSPAHSTNLIGHRCDDVTAAATGDWSFGLLAFSVFLLFQCMLWTVKQAGCRNRLNIETTKRSYSLCVSKPFLCIDQMKSVFVTEFNLPHLFITFMIYRHLDLCSSSTGFLSPCHL